MIERLGSNSIYETSQAVFETDRILPSIPRIFDLPSPPINDEGVKRGMDYETDCLNLIANSEPENYYIFGPNLISQAFERTLFANGPLPDAFVFRPNQNGTLSLVEISEFKLGKTKSQRKIWGFRKLIGKIKTNQDQFNYQFHKATGDEYFIPRLTLPSNDNIIFTFATPRIPHHGNGMYLHNSPCPVFYFQVIPAA